MYATTQATSDTYRVLSTPSHRLTTAIGLVRTWVSAGSKAECDTNAGEVYLKQSPGKGLSLDQCKQACEDNADCQSMTYYRTGWCSHYSTLCTKTRRNGKVVATLRLVATSGSTTGSASTSVSATTSGSGSTTTANPARTWVQAGTRVACDTRAGEVYMKQSPGKVANLEQCKQSCEGTAGCQGITFFRTRWCSLFSTTCTTLQKMNNAVGAFRLPQ